MQGTYTGKSSMSFIVIDKNAQESHKSRAPAHFFVLKKLFHCFLSKSPFNGLNVFIFYHRHSIQYNILDRGVHGATPQAGVIVVINVFLFSRRRRRRHGKKKGAPRGKQKITSNINLNFAKP